jgi:hypothetical protein
MQEHATDGEITSNTNVNYPAVWSDQQWLERKGKQMTNSKERTFKL